MVVPLGVEFENMADFFVLRSLEKKRRLKEFFQLEGVLY